MSALFHLTIVFPGVYLLPLFLDASEEVPSMTCLLNLSDTKVTFGKNMPSIVNICSSAVFLSDPLSEHCLQLQLHTRSRTS